MSSINRIKAGRIFKARWMGLSWRQIEARMPKTLGMKAPGNGSTAMRVGRRFGIV